MLKLLIILILLSATTCVIYNVTPDDTTCHHCHNLQHYLLNATKYFTSNTQLLFLPGLHHLHTNLIIQNVHNISLIGSTTNGTTPDTVIQCNSSVGIVMNNITSLIMKNMIFKNCTTGYDILTETHIAILITWCSFVQLHSIQTNYTNTSSIKGINTFGDLTLVNLTCDSIILHYNKTAETLNYQIVVIIDNFHFAKNSKRYGIVVSKFKECYTNITLQLTNLHVNTSNNAFYKPILYFSTVTLNHDKVFITNSYFQGTTLHEEQASPFYIYTYPYTSLYFNNCSFQYPLHAAGIITIRNGSYMEINQCNFSGKGTQTFFALINAGNCSNVAINNSNFFSNAVQLLKIQQKYNHNNTQTIIQNTTFSSNLIEKRSLIHITNTTLVLKDKIVFKRNIGEKDYFIDHKTIFELHNSSISAHGYIEFSENNLGSIIYHICQRELDCFVFSVLGRAVINITSNLINTYFIAEFPKHSSKKIIHPVCYFQYFNVRHYRFHTVEKNKSIVIQNNKYKGLTLEHKTPYADSQLHITHCYWLPQSAFNGIIPTDINKQYVRITNNSRQLPKPVQNKTLCYCTNEQHFDCYREDLGFVYPGQTLTIPLHYHHYFVFTVEVIAETITNITYLSSCIVHDAKQNKQLIKSNCTKLNYTIAFPNDNWCELFLTISHVTPVYYNKFYIRQLPCPLGFKKTDGTCQCYPSFIMYGITKCDIDTQTILRPANTWIFENSYYIFHFIIVYHIHFISTYPLLIHNVSLTDLVYCVDNVNMV